MNIEGRAEADDLPLAGQDSLFCMVKLDLVCQLV